MIPYTNDIEIFSEQDRTKVAELYLASPPGLRMQRTVIPDNSLGRRILFSVLGLLGGRTVKPLTPDSVKSVLLFRNDAIGDYILTTPLIRWLHENCPNASIDVVGSERNRILLDADPFVRDVFTVTHKRGLSVGWFSRLGIPRSAKYDLVLSLTHTAMTKAAIQAVKFGKGALRITHKHDARSHIYGRVFQKQVEHVVAYTHWAETIANAATEALGKTERVVPQAYVTLVPSAIERVHAELSKLNCRYDVRHVANAVVPERTNIEQFPTCAGKMYVVVNVSSFEKARRWATTPCADVLRKLCTVNPDVHYFVTGGPSDAEVYLQVAQMVNLPNCTVWENGIMELVALIAGSRMVISPDTAVVHMAATSGVPVVSLYRKLITVAEWFPYDTKFRALLSPSEDTINNIHPNLIVKQAQELMWQTQH